MALAVSLVSLLITGLCASAQLPPAKPAAAPAKKAESDPKREKARELLDKAGETIAAATPEAQVAALMHIAASYEVFDKKKSLELLEQAFAGASSLPEDRSRRGSAMGQIVHMAAGIDVEVALDMLRRFPPPVSADARDPRTNAVSPIVSGLIQKKSYDRAMQALDIAAEGGQYPYNSANSLMRALPRDDPRKLQIFGRATTAFSGRDARSFGQMISDQSKALPQSVIEPAVRALVGSVLDRKDEGTTTFMVSSAKGSAAFASMKEAELFDIMHVLRAVDPKKADEVLERYPDLRRAVERFPEGTASMRESENESNISTSVSSSGKGSQRDPEAEARMVRDGMQQARYAEAERVARTDPDKGIAMARDVEDPAMRARLLGTFASAMAQKDAAAAKPVLNQCMQLLESIKSPNARLPVLMLIAEAAHRTHDDEQAWAALYKAVDAAAELHREDSDAEAPNKAPRDLWPSTQAYRTVAHRAAVLFGVESQAILTRIGDPEMTLLATVHLARGLLGKDRGDTSTSISRSRPSR
jgi:hypothetical protein